MGLDENYKNMQKFYNEICEKYDYIFPLNSTQKKFLNDEIKGRKILDVGAATGKLALYLSESEKELSITSIDINEKLILKAAKKGIEVKKMDMLKIDILSKFDTIINIGNTLPHLNSKDEIVIFLEKAYDRMEEKGKLIIQTVNFNKFIAQRGTDRYLGSLPLIENENVKFERHYYLNEDENIIFKTVLDNKTENYEILLNIQYSELKSYMKKVGFKNLKFYGGFDRSDFNRDESIYLVITGEK